MCSETLNNRIGGPNNEYRGGPGGPGTGFCSPGGGFSGSRRSGKPLRLLRLKKPPPGLQKPVPGPPGPTRDSLLAPPGRLLTVLEYFFLLRTAFLEGKAKGQSTSAPFLFHIGTYFCRQTCKSECVYMCIYTYTYVFTQGLDAAR